MNSLNSLSSSSTITELFLSSPDKSRSSLSSSRPVYGISVKMKPPFVNLSTYLQPFLLFKKKLLLYQIAQICWLVSVVLMLFLIILSIMYLFPVGTAIFRRLKLIMESNCTVTIPLKQYGYI